MPRPLSAVLVVALLAPGAAAAADYVFSVPVELEQMPRGVARAQVQCQVFGDRTGGPPLGSGSTSHALDFRTGALQRSFTVRVNLRPERQGQLPGYYVCRLLLLAPWSNPPWQAPSEEAMDPAMRPAPDTEFRAVAEGELPRPPAAGLRTPPGRP